MPASQRDSGFGLLPKCGKVPAGGDSVTKEGSSWVLGEEVALGAATGHVSPGPP